MQRGGWGLDPAGAKSTSVCDDDEMRGFGVHGFNDWPERIALSLMSWGGWGGWKERGPWGAGLHEWLRRLGSESLKNLLPRGLFYGFALRTSQNGAVLQSQVGRLF